MYEGLKEVVKKQLIDKSKEELIDILSEYIIAYFLSMTNAAAKIVGCETVQLINNQIEINQESMEVKGVNNEQHLDSERLSRKPYGIPKKTDKEY